MIFFVFFSMEIYASYDSPAFTNTPIEILNSIPNGQNMAKKTGFFAILWLFYGYSMALLWLLCCIVKFLKKPMVFVFSTAILRLFYGYSMAILWLFYGYSMSYDSPAFTNTPIEILNSIPNGQNMAKKTGFYSILWLFYGYFMAILWLLCCIVKFLKKRRFMSFLRLFYGYSMAILWLFYGYSMAILCHTILQPSQIPQSKF